MPLPENIIRQLQEKQAAESESDAKIPVYTGDWPALLLFLMISRAGLWRYGPMGHRLGIDWAQARNYPMIPADTEINTWAGVTFIENGFFSELNN